MDVSENGGTPKSSILIGFSIINHPFWGTPIFGNTHIGNWKMRGISKNLKISYIIVNCWLAWDSIEVPRIESQRDPFRRGIL